MGRKLQALVVGTPGRLGVADNVLKPGSPVFLWANRMGDSWKALTSWALNEFLHSGLDGRFGPLEDWVAVLGHPALSGSGIPAPTRRAPELGRSALASSLRK